MRAVFLALLLSTTVVATVRAEPTSADVESARQLLRQGNELRAKGDERAALARYKSAHALVGTPITGFEVGRTYVQLGELVEGYQALTDVTKIPLKPNESASTTTARKEADRLAHELEPRIPSIRVFVKNIVSRSTLVIQLDGTRIEPGVAHKVNPGKHALVVQDKGSSRTSEVTVAEGEARDVEVVLDPAPAPTHIPNLAEPSPTATTTSRTPTWIYVGFGVAGAFAIAGTVAGTVTLTRTDGLSQSCPGGDCPPAEHDRLKTTERWATVSTVSFVVAGAAAAVSVVGLLTTNTKKKSDAASIRPMIGLGSIGLQGTF